jgi:imidazolonepropionase-like amidohydrolase
LKRSTARSCPQQEKIVKALHDAGAQFLAGTDSSFFRNEPSFALHWEMELLVESELSPYEALRSSTTNAQRFLANSPTRGSIAVGQDADLVLIAGNPLDDVANCERGLKTAHRR